MQNIKQQLIVDIRGLAFHNKLYFEYKKTEAFFLV